MIRNRALDGLRGVAALLVVCSHTLPSAWTEDNVWLFTSLGRLGVLLFFVLSGYLITGILIDARSQANRAGVSMLSVWGRFHARRALRIFPLAYLALFVAGLAGFRDMTLYPWWHLTYLQNVGMAIHGDAWPGDLAHFWTLAVEEQFYLLWPALLLFFPANRATAVIVVTSVVGLAAKLAVDAVWSEAASNWLLTGELHMFTIGGLAAVHPRLAVRLVWLSPLLILLGQYETPEARSAVGVGYALACAGLVANISTSRSRFSQWASLPPLVWLGTISYGVYVWHGMVPGLAINVLGVPWPDYEQGVWWIFPVVLGSSVALATASWWLIERPILSLKQFVPYVGNRRVTAAPSVGLSSLPRSSS